MNNITHFWAFVPGATRLRLLKILSSIPSLEDAWRHYTDLQYEHSWLPDHQKIFSQIESSYQSCLRLGVDIVSFLCPEYPLLLRQIPDAPAFLFYKGNLPSSQSFAVVGSRKITEFGRKSVQVFVPDISSHFTIVSGLAYGVDAAAHQATLASGNRTVAVIAGGISYLSPRTHVSLAEKILETGGAIISEYPPNTQIESYMFPSRNRIIAGLSKGVLCIEGGEKSGSLITASCALQYNRDVFALAHSWDTESSRGTNMLIQKGTAMLTLSPKDILDQYNIFPQSSSRLVSLNEEERSVYNLVGKYSSLDDIVHTLQVPVPRVLSILSRLEQKHLIMQSSGGFTRMM